MTSREKNRIACKKWKQKNPETRASYKKKWREANREKIREQQKKLRQANREKIRAQNKKWREENREKCRAYGKKWREKNLEKRENVHVIGLDRIRTKVGRHPSGGKKQTLSVTVVGKKETRRRCGPQNINKRMAQ